MSWLSKLLGQKEKPEVEEGKPEEAQDQPEDAQDQSEEAPGQPEEEIQTNNSASKRAKRTTKATPPSSDVAKSSYIPVPENDAKLVASNFEMLSPGAVAAALYLEQMPAKPFVVYGFISCVCTELLPITLSVIPGMHTEHSVTCPKCNTIISGSKGAMENFVIVTAGIDEVSRQYRSSGISITLDRLTNI